MRAANNDAAPLHREIGDLHTRLVRLEARQPGRRRHRHETADMYDLQEWVLDFFPRAIERRVSNTRRWCSKWYEHPEAVHRLWLLFQSYHETVFHEDAAGMSTWYIDHLDRHLDALLSADGPFAACSPQRHTPARSLPVDRAPAGLWGPRLKDLGRIDGRRASHDLDDTPVEVNP